MSRTTLVSLAALTLIGGWLRFSATSFGLPDKYRPDEEYMVSRALGFERDWNPHFTVYPAAHMYVQHGVLRAYAALQGATGADFRRAYASDGQALAYLLARRTSAAFGTVTIPAIYWAGAPAFGPAGALAAAAIVTFAPIHVRDSKYATTDAPTVFWLTIAVGFALRVVRRGRYRESLLAGLISGLAVANKYPAGAVVFGVGFAHLEARFREGRTLWRSFRDLRLYVAAYAAVIAFVCATPYFFLDWAQTLKDFEYQRGFLARGVGNTLAGWGWSWLLLRAMPDSFGLALTVLLLLGLVWAIVRPRLGTLSLVTFVLVASVGMTSSRYSFYRYVLVPFPGLALLAGRLVGEVADAVARRMPAARTRLAVAAALVLLLAPSIVRDYKLNRILSRRDTRTLARQWIEENVPRPAMIAATDHRTPYGKPQLPYGYTLVALEDLKTLRAKGVRYVLADSSPLAFYSRGPDPAEFRQLEKQATLVFDVDPIKTDTPPPVFDMADAFYAPLQHASSMKRPGPRIRVWRID